MDMDAHITHLKLLLMPKRIIFSSYKSFSLSVRKSNFASNLRSVS